MNGRQSDIHRNRRFGDVLRRAADFDRFCWLYPQHRNITLLRIEMLDPEQRQSLEHGSRLRENTKLCDLNPTSLYNTRSEERPHSSSPLARYRRRNSVRYPAKVRIG